MKTQIKNFSNLSKVLTLACLTLCSVVLPDLPRKEALQQERERLARVFLLSEQFNEQLTCLAWNSFFEGRSTSPTEQQAIAEVVLNRAKKAGTTACQEVFRPKQFSWTHQKGQKIHPKELKLYKTALEASYRAMSKEYKKVLPADACWYHATRVNPEKILWTKKLRKVKIQERSNRTFDPLSIGSKEPLQHIFYRS